MNILVIPVWRGLVKATSPWKSTQTCIQYNTIQYLFKRCLARLPPIISSRDNRGRICPPPRWWLVPNHFESKECLLYSENMLHALPTRRSNFKRWMLSLSMLLIMIWFINSQMLISKVGIVPEMKDLNKMYPQIYTMK